MWGQNHPVRDNETEIIDIPALGMWLFLASEAMFFIAMLGAFIVLQSTGQQHDLFVRSSQMLAKWIGLCGAVLLLFSSGALLRFPKQYPWLAILIGASFILLTGFQWVILLDRHTCVARSGVHAVVLDGDEAVGTDGLHIDATRINLMSGFDIHAVTAADFPGYPYWEIIKVGDVLQDCDYGPSRNNFFASYFLLSAVHGLHLIAGLAALLWFLLFRRGKIPPALQNYWHFVNLVGIIGLAALYFV